MLLLSGFVRNEATLTADIAAARGRCEVMPGYGAMVARLTDPADFPALHRAIASGALDDDDDLGHRVRLRPRAHPRRDRRAHPPATQGA